MLSVSRLARTSLPAGIGTFAARLSSRLGAPSLGHLVWNGIKVVNRSDPFDVERRRADLERYARLLINARGARFSQIDAGGVPAEWLTFDDLDPERVLFHLHGGGYVVGSPRTHRALVSRMARRIHAAALTPDYRLAPEHPFPAALDDAVAAYQHLLDSGIDANNIVVSGDSAGGGLAAATLIRLRDEGLPLPAAAVLLSPWTDMTLSGASWHDPGINDPMLHTEGAIRAAEAYLAGSDPKHPLASPLFADLSGLPPLLIHVGSAEIILDDSRGLAVRASEAGVDVTLEVWRDQIHVFHALGPFSPVARRAMDEIAAFVAERVPVGAVPAAA